MVGISLHTHLALDGPARVTVTFVLPPTPGILVTPPDGPPKYLDLSLIAQLVFDFGDRVPSPAPPSVSLP
jgi:hypothetical protein